MKKLLYVPLFFFCLICYSQENSNNSEEIEKRKMRASYMGYLTAEGYLPSIDDDGDIKFKVEGETYYIIVKNTRIFILQKFLNNSNGCSDILYKTLKTANRRFRNITIYSLNDDCSGVAIKSASWLENEDDFKDIFKISLDIVKNADEATQEFYAEYSGDGE